MAVIKLILLLVISIVAAIFVLLAYQGGLPSVPVMAVLTLLYFAFIFLILPLGRPDNTATLIMRFHFLLALVIGLFATFVAVGGECIASTSHPYYSGQALANLVMAVCNNGYRYVAAVILYGMSFSLLLAGYEKTRRVATQPTFIQ
ncbi:MAG TPA: hypothetical protein VN023_06715 [Methylovorus sp.]|jgi:hypothetical protein|nr:hypothetical protein [Methylovorus sp.]